MRVRIRRASVTTNTAPIGFGHFRRASSSVPQIPIPNADREQSSVSLVGGSPESEWILVHWPDQAKIREK